MAPVGSVSKSIPKAHPYAGREPDKFITITFSNSQFGLLRINTGEFHVLGQNLSPCGSHEGRSRTSFQTNRRCLQVRRVSQQRCARELLTNQNLVTFSPCNQVKGGLA